MSGEYGFARLTDREMKRFSQFAEQIKSAFENGGLKQLAANIEGSIFGKGRRMLAGFDEIWNATAKVKQLQDALEKLKNGEILKENDGLFTLGGKATKEAIDKLDEYSKSIVAAVQSGEAAGSSMLTLQKHVGAVGLKAKAAALGVNLLRTALNTLVPMLIIEGISQFITYITQAGERAAEAADKVKDACVYYIIAH